MAVNSMITGVEVLMLGWANMDMVTEELYHLKYFSLNFFILNISAVPSDVARCTCIEE
jgi:hypothetical protein